MSSMQSHNFISGTSSTSDSCYRRIEPNITSIGHYDRRNQHRARFDGELLLYMEIYGSGVLNPTTRFFGLMKKVNLIKITIVKLVVVVVVCTDTDHCSMT